MGLISEFDGWSLVCRGSAISGELSRICHRGEENVGCKIWEVRSENVGMEVKELGHLGERKEVLHESGNRKAHKLGVLFAKPHQRFGGMFWE